MALSFKKLLSFCFALMFLFSCTSHVQSREKKSVMVSIPPYASFIEKISHNTLDIGILVPSGMNLHTFEPTPKQIEQFKDAKIWFTIGETFEKKIIAALKEKNPKLLIVDLRKNIPLLFSDVKALPPCDHGKANHHHEGADLHIWMNPNLALRQCKLITATLQKTFPENRETYQENYDGLSRELQNLNRSITQKLSPYKGSAILVSHPAFGYFCDQYGLVQLSVECEGKEPRPRDVGRILEKAKEYDVRSAFVQPGFPNRGLKLIAKKLQLPIYEINPYARDYFTNMQYITDLITK